MFGVVVGGESVNQPIWRTARRCESGACIEIGALADSILIRNSADQDGPRLAISRGGWRDFVAGAKNGDFDGL
jgi:Domain of unknown function (DUF397)